MPSIDALHHMSKSRRLWVILSIVLGALSGMVAYKQHSQAFAIVEYPVGMANQAFWANAHADPELSNCDWKTVRHDEPYDGFTMVTCDTNDPYTPALLWALFPAVLMAGVIFTIRRLFPPKPV